MFLLFLVVRFARENKNTESKDPVLDRIVPSIVSLRNQKLLKQAMKERFEDIDKAKEFLRQKA